MVIEEQKEEHLEARAEELIALALGESSAKLCVTKLQLPVQLPAVVVLGIIELSKRGHGNANFMRDTLEELGVLLIIGPLTLRDDFDIKVDV